MWVKFKSTATDGAYELMEVKDNVFISKTEDTCLVRVCGDLLLQNVPMALANFVVNRIFDELTRGANTLDIEAVIAEFNNKRMM